MALPPLTYEYEFSVLNCTVNNTDLGGCPIYVSVGNGNMPPFDLDDLLVNCTNSTEKCRLKVMSPNLAGFNFVGFYLRDINSSALVDVTWKAESQSKYLTHILLFSLIVITKVLRMAMFFFSCFIAWQLIQFLGFIFLLYFILLYFILLLYFLLLYLCGFSGWEKMMIKH